MADVSSNPAFSLRVPEGDDRIRRVCDSCGFVDYVNPKVVVGAVAVWEGSILMCRRAIEPRRGFWTLPAGFLEEGESVEDGARREAREEACAELIIDGLLAVYSIPRISQVQLMFRARIADGRFAPGPESLETKLVPYAAIPWGELAFPSVAWALRQHQDWLEGRARPPFTNPAATSPPG